MQIDTTITLNDVIGLDDAKTILKERLVDYIQFKDMLKYSPSHGILLYGYPGTGKTMLVIATMNSFKNPQIMFEIVESDTLTGDVSTTEKKVRTYFKNVRDRAQGKTIVLLMDEVDQLIPRKFSQGVGGIITARISAILKELDGIEEKNKNIYIIATTNHPNKIEPAFLRSGRIDDSIKVELPNEDERMLLLEKYLGHIPGCTSWDNVIIPMAAYTEGWTGADYKKLAGKLELQYHIQSTPLETTTIIKIVSEVNKQRKKNYEIFAKEYRHYQKNKP